MVGEMLAAENLVVGVSLEESFETSGAGFVIGAHHALAQAMVVGRSGAGLMQSVRAIYRRTRMVASTGDVGRRQAIFQAPSPRPDMAVLVVSSSPNTNPGNPVTFALAVTLQVIGVAPGAHFRPPVSWNRAGV
jgi:hypothetical protein